MKRHELAARRKAIGKSQEKLAQELGVNTGTVARWERGEMTPGADIRRRYADLLDVTVTQLSYWIDSNGDEPQLLAPKWFSLFVSSEQTATAVQSWGHAVIPGLLQTRDYARALIEGEHGDGVEELLDLRMSRHAAINDRQPPLELHAILAEGALKVRVGDSEVMAGQRAHLLELSSRPNLSIRVLPFDAGPHTAELSFHILTLPWGAEIAYYESYDGAHYEESDVSSFRSRYQRLAEMSLSFTESRDLILEVSNHDHVA